MNTCVTLLASGRVPVLRQLHIWARVVTSVASGPAVVKLQLVASNVSFHGRSKAGNDGTYMMQAAGNTSTVKVGSQSARPGQKEYLHQSLV